MVEKGDADARWQSVLSALRTMHTDTDIERFLRSLETQRSPVVIAFVNAHVMNVARTQGDLAEHLSAADYLLRDGVGMSILLRMLGQSPGKNLNGTDLIPRILECAQGRSIGLFGTDGPPLEQAARAIGERFGISRDQIITEHGFHDVSRYLELVRKYRPQFVILGMGVPKQEAVAAALKADLDYGCVIVNGGAIIDFLGGKVRRAPPLMQSLRMEWLFRLALEPKRLFRRYVIGNPLFLWRSFRYSLSAPHGSDDLDVPPPARQIHVGRFGAYPKQLADHLRGHPAASSVVERRSPPRPDGLQAYPEKDQRPDGR